MKNLIQTNQKIEVANYPYGYTLKTILFDTMEFNAKKGYRHITQTINPKNGRLNAEKKSTYAPLKVRFFDENGHIKVIVFDFNGGKAINKAMNFINENFELFTTKEIEYFYYLAFSMLKCDVMALIQYAGMKFDDLKPIYNEISNKMIEGIKNPTLNNFNVNLDVEKIDSLRDVNYQPFKIVEYNY